MMTQPSDERRGARRIPVHDQQLSALTSRSVRVLDIGLGGALLACLPPVPQGGTLRLALGSAPFVSVIDVKHRRQDQRSGEMRVGVTFVRMTAESRAALEQFLARAGRQN